VSEEIIVIQNGHLFPNNDVWLLAAASMGVSITRSALKSPKLNQITPQYIRPFIGAVLPGNNPNVAWWFQNPFRLNAQEEIANVISNNLATGTERQTTIALLSDTPNVDPVPMGDFFTSRFTSTSTATANAWTTIPITFEQQIPVGNYDVWQAEVTSANIQAFRFVFDNQYYRPGWLGTAALGNRQPDQFYQGVLGKWGRFRTVSLPRLQVLCNAADASFEGYLRYIKVGS
jgi:hypothetical protein